MYFLYQQIPNHCRTKFNYCKKNPITNCQEKLNFYQKVHNSIENTQFVLKLADLSKKLANYQQKIPISFRKIYKSYEK